MQKHLIDIFHEHVCVCYKRLTLFGRVTYVEINLPKSSENKKGRRRDVENWKINYDNNS